MRWGEGLLLNASKDGLRRNGRSTATLPESGTQTQDHKEGDSLETREYGVYITCGGSRQKIQKKKSNEKTKPMARLLGGLGSNRAGCPTQYIVSLTSLQEAVTPTLEVFI